MRDNIEFWIGEKVIMRVDSSIVPSIGQFVSIQKKTYQVLGVSFAVDYADKVHERAMRCNVQLEGPI